MADDLELQAFVDADAWYEWLRQQHDTSPGIWMRIARKSSAERTVTWEESVPPALCWGWIDGQRRSLDDASYLVRFTPRRARSVWSSINVAHVERLVADGLMQPAGLAQVDAAKADGRWDVAYSSSRSLEVPPELQAALDADPAAAAAFLERSKQDRFSMCYRVQSVKRDETKQRHVARFVELLRRGEPLY